MSLFDVYHMYNARTLNSPYKILILANVNKYWKQDFDLMLFKPTFKLWKCFSCLKASFRNLLSFLQIDIHRWNTSCTSERVFRVLVLLWVLSFSISSYSLKCAFFSLKNHYEYYFFIVCLTFAWKKVLLLLSYYFEVI